MSRAAVYQLLATDSALNAEGIVQDSVFQTNAVENPESRPFLVLRWETKNASFKNIGLQFLSIWVHDERGDYSRIDRILKRVIEILVDAVHVAGDDGSILTMAEYQSTSDDFWDDGYRTITKYATFRIISRAA